MYFYNFISFLFHFQRRVRAAYSEIAFKGWRRAEYVVGIIDKSLQTLENCDIADIVEIVQNTTSMDLALKQLKIECKICFNSHPQTKVSITHTTEPTVKNTTHYNHIRIYPSNYNMALATNYATHATNHTTHYNLQNALQTAQYTP